jgi:hemerythrin
MPVCWEAKYSTGEATIDQQHQALFAYVNKLETQLQAKTIDQELVGSVLQYMTMYAQTHFVYEELCMHRVKCPAAQTNQDAHDKFMKLVEIFEARFAQEGATPDLVEKVYRACADWLTNHICKIDTELRALVG